VEVYLACGSIAETTPKWHTSHNSGAFALRKRGFPSFGTVPDAPVFFFFYSNPIQHRVQGPRSGRTHSLRKEKACLVLVAGGRPGFLTPYDPPHPAALKVHWFEKRGGKQFYSAYLAWEEKRPFALVQVRYTWRTSLDKGGSGQNFKIISGRRGSFGTCGRFSRRKNKFVFSILGPRAQPYEQPVFLKFMLWVRGLGVKGKGSFADELGLGVWGKQPKGTEASPKEILRAPWSTLGKNPFGKKRTKQQGSTVLSHG